MFGGQGFVVVLALWMAIGVIVLTMCLFGVVVAIRVVHASRSRWRERVTRRWRDVLTRSLIEVPTRVPKVSAREAQIVLPLWVYFHEFVEGDCKERLNRVGRLAGIDLYAKRRLRGDGVRQRLMAIQALGHLRDRELLRLLRPIARFHNPYLSLAAAHALLRIAPTTEVASVLTMIGARPDWSPARVMAMLREAGPEAVSEPLAAACLEADDAYRPLLLVYLSTAQEDTALRTIREVLVVTADQQVTITCLYQLGRLTHPDGLKVVRAYLEHPNWLIQLHAVAGLGRMGGEADIDDLVRMLRHKKYWIRLRAAQALKSLPTMNEPRLAQIREQQQDRFARDILRQVIGGSVAA